MIKIVKALRYAVLTGAILYIPVCFLVAFLRIKFPFELEWAEGVTFEYARRIMTGQGIYVSPSIEFVPYFYTPLYYWFAAMMAKIAGLNWVSFRSISFMASIGSMSIIFLFVRRETRNYFSSMLAASFFAAVFPLTGRWFDMARVDPLYLFFLLAALYLIKFKEEARYYILAGILFSLSFLTKQTALAFIFSTVFYCILANRHLCIAFIGTVAVIIGGSTVLFNYFSNGWYAFYVFWLPMLYPMEDNVLICIWHKFPLVKIAIAFALSISYIFRQYFTSNKKDYLFYLLTSVCAIVTAFLGLLQIGGHSSLLLPVYAVMAILFGLAVNGLLEYTRYLPLQKRKAAELYVYLIVMMQFLVLVYKPADMIPHKQTAETSRKYVNAISRIKGEVLAPGHSYLLVLAGKRSYTNWDALASITLIRHEIPIKIKLINELKQAIREKRFSVIILHAPAEKFVIEEVEKYYRQYETLPTPANMRWLGEGRLYTPKKSGVDNFQSGLR